MNEELIEAYLLQELRAEGHIDRDAIFRGNNSDYLIEISAYKIGRDDD